MTLDRLVRASIEGAIAVVVVATVCRLLPLSASARAALWWCATAKFIVALVWTMPIALPILPPTVPALAPAVVDAGLLEAAAGSLPSVMAARAAPPSMSVWPRVVAALWIAGVLAIGMMSLRQWRQTRSMVRAAAPAPQAIDAMVADLAVVSRVVPAPAVKLSADVATPLVTGLKRPVILLPQSALALLPPDDLRMALGHELAHLRRQDLRWGIVPVVAEALFFFHPLARYAAREYALGRESACDAAAMAATGAAPADYARVLVGLGVTRPLPRLAAAGAAQSFASFKRRLVMLHTPTSRTFSARLLGGAVVAAAALALVPVELTARSGLTIPVVAGAEALLPQNPPAPPTPPAPPPAPPTPPALPPAPPMATVTPLAMPMAPPVAPAPPAPPAPPVPPTQVERQSAARDVSFVVFRRDGSHTMNGSMDDLARAKELRTGDEPFLWVRRNGREYISRDPDVLQKLEAAWKPVGEIGAAQGKLGAEQGAIGAKQGDIGRRKAEVGVEQARIAVRQAEIAMSQARVSVRGTETRTEAELQALEAERRELAREMRALSERMREAQAPMDDLSAQMRTLSERMTELSTKMREAVRTADSETRRILDAAIASGAAQPVK